MTLDGCCFGTYRARGPCDPSVPTRGFARPPPSCSPCSQPAGRQASSPPPSTVVRGLSGRRGGARLLRADDGTHPGQLPGVRRGGSGNDQGAAVVQRSSAQRNGKSFDDRGVQLFRITPARRSRSGSTGATRTRPTRSRRGPGITPASENSAPSATKPEVKIALVAEVVEACLVLRGKGRSEALLRTSNWVFKTAIVVGSTRSMCPSMPWSTRRGWKRWPMSLTIWLIRLMAPSPTSVCLVTVVRSGSPRSSHLTHGKRRVRQLRRGARGRHPPGWGRPSRTHAVQARGPSPSTRSTCKPRLERGWRSSLLARRDGEPALAGNRVVRGRFLRPVGRLRRLGHRRLREELRQLGAARRPARSSAAWSERR